MISLIEYELLQFTKRGYTEKYPAIKLPKRISRPALKRAIIHLTQALNSKKTEQDSELDKSQDKFDGTKSNYDEKVAM